MWRSVAGCLAARNAMGSGAACVKVLFQQRVLLAAWRKVSVLMSCLPLGVALAKRAGRVGVVAGKGSSVLQSTVVASAWSSCPSSAMRMSCRKKNRNHMTTTKQQVKAQS